MRAIRGKFPPFACRNADFTNGQRKVGPDERTIDMAINVEDLPGTGSLCIHERTVRKMVKLLGWELDRGLVDATEVAALEGRILELEGQLAQIKESISA